MKILSVGAYLLHADTRTDRRTVRRAYRPTDMTKLVIDFRNFAKEPKMVRVQQTQIPLQTLIPLSVLATSICRLLDGHF
jgi:hypothetical protein